MVISRRSFIAGLCATAALAAVWSSWPPGSKAEEEEFPVHMSNAEWKKKLGPEAFYVMREQGTEHAFTSPLYNEERKGEFRCKGCETLLFRSSEKFDSGTGWPSFWQPAAAQAVAEKKDYTLGIPRTEVHCATCGGHLGHVFEDGPQPTGLRYCINGVCLDFKPSA